MGQRIRTIKPVMWADEDVRACSRDARLLGVVLITFADDDGRFQDLPRAIAGFGYPEDDDVTPRKISAWIDELCDTGPEPILVRYEVNGKRYATFPKWHAHQRINRYTPSSLPPCPVTAGIVIVPHPSHGKRTEDSVSEHDNGTAPSPPDRETGDRSKEPPQPPVNGGSDLPPVKPSGKRKTDLDTFTADMQAWGARHFPGAELGAVAAAVDWMRSRDGSAAVTAGTVRDFAASSDVWAAQLGLTESATRGEPA